jgi:hypothetical protein
MKHGSESVKNPDQEDIWNRRMPMTSFKTITSDQSADGGFNHW